MRGRSGCSGHIQLVVRHDNPCPDIDMLAAQRSSGLGSVMMATYLSPSTSNESPNKRQLSPQHEAAGLSAASGLIPLRISGFTESHCRGRGHSQRSSGNRTLHQGRGFFIAALQFSSRIVQSNVRAANQRGDAAVERYRRRIAAAGLTPAVAAPVAGHEEPHPAEDQTRSLHAHGRPNGKRSVNATRAQ